MRLGFLLPVIVMLSACAQKPVTSDTASNPLPPAQTSFPGRAPAGEKRDLGKIDEAEARSCADVLSWMCKLSPDQEKQLDKNISSCDILHSNSGETALQFLILRNSGDFVTAKLRGAGVTYENCPSSRIDLAGDKAVEVLAIDNKAYIRTQKNRMLVGYADGKLKAVPNSKNEIYESVQDFKIEGKNLKLFFTNGQDYLFTEDTLNDRLERCGSKCNMKTVDAGSISSNSLLRDRRR